MGPRARRAGVKGWTPGTNDVTGVARFEAAAAGGVGGPIARWGLIAAAGSGRTLRRDGVAPGTRRGKHHAHKGSQVQDVAHAAFKVQV